jgi:uncharacterized RDD family membrane protein YckC
MRAQRLAIRTAEGIVFNLTLAGPVSRSLAWLIDAACIAAASKIISGILALFGFISQDFSRAVLMVLFFMFNMGYAMVLEWRWHGQTVGKRLLGLRVMDLRGLRLHFSQIAIRNLLRAVDSLPLLYLVGGLAVLINRHAQRLGDIAANTVVVRELQLKLPDLDTFLAKVHYNSLRDYPHLVARLRQRITPEEAGLALQVLIRRNELAADARVSLFDDMAVHFKKKVAFPPQATESLSSEQFIRNVVDVLFTAYANSKGNDSMSG